MRDGDPWFDLSDVAAVLEISRGRDGGRMLTDDQTGAHIVLTPGGRKADGYQQPATEQHMRRCWQMAHSVAGPVQQAPQVERVESRAVVASLGDLATMIESTDGVYPTDVALAKLSTACAQRLAQRVICRAGNSQDEAKAA